MREISGHLFQMITKRFIGGSLLLRIFSVAVVVVVIIIISTFLR